MMFELPIGSQTSKDKPCHSLTPCLLGKLLHRVHRLGTMAAQRCSVLKGAEVVGLRGVFEEVEPATCSL